MRIGIYNHFWLAKGGGEKLALTMASHLSRKHEVVLLGSLIPDLKELSAYFDVDLSRVQSSKLPVPTFMMDGKVQGATRFQRLGWQLAKWQQRRQETSTIRQLNLDFFINHSFASNLACPTSRGMYCCMFPPPVPHSRWDRLQQRLALFRCDETGSTYSVIMGISEFDNVWIKKRWNKEALLIYPACGQSEQTNIPKRQTILSVGRIMSGMGHDKRHDALIEAFGRIEAQAREGWELVIIGSCPPLPQAQEYLAKLRHQAQGLAVTIIPNAPFEDLQKAYQEAAIYWHATGYGTSNENQPELQEHFGITTVEAMFAGAVPIVINAGAQPEIVQHGVSGYVWNDLDGLAELTAQVMQDATLRARLSQQAVFASERFSDQAFYERLDELVEPLIQGRK